MGSRRRVKIKEPKIFCVSCGEELAKVRAGKIFIDHGLGQYFVTSPISAVCRKCGSLIEISIDDAEGTKEAADDGAG